MRRGSMTFVAALLTCAAGFLTPSCNLSQKNQPPTFSNNIGWAASNVDLSYGGKWGDTQPATAFRLFQVLIDDPDGREDIVEIDVIDPEGRTWYIEDHYLEAYSYWGGWWYYVDSRPNRVELGIYEVVARDSAGHEITSSVSFNSPGSLGGSGFLYSEDYTGSTVGGVEMLNRASNLSGTKGASDLSISFSVNDSRVFNGWIWFYDGSADFITNSDWFKDTINGGSGLNTGGTSNTVNLSVDDLDLGSYAFSDIAGFHVILTDGAQYAPEDTYFDHRSISAYEVFP
jgi:hypothetical protein